MASMFNRTIGGFLNQPAKPARPETPPAAATPVADGEGAAGQSGGAGAGAAGGPDGARTFRQRPRFQIAAPTTPAPRLSLQEASPHERPPTPAGPSSGAGAGNGSEVPGAQDSITLGQLKAMGPPPVPKQKVHH